jgi:hypothetical protein
MPTDPPAILATRDRRAAQIQTTLAACRLPGPSDLNRDRRRPDINKRLAAQRQKLEFIGIEISVVRRRADVASVAVKNHIPGSNGRVIQAAAGIKRGIRKADMLRGAGRLIKRHPAVGFAVWIRPIAQPNIDG